MAASDTPSDANIPSSILIVGSGVFGLSTAYALCKDPLFEKASITLVEQSPFPNPLGSSIDSSRIIRADYADPDYVKFALEAQKEWRGHWGADGRYQENGLVLTVDPDLSEYVDKSLASVRELLAKGGVQTAADGSPAMEVLSSREDIMRVLGRCDGCSGSKGYINRTSGWADAEASMVYLRSLVDAFNRVTFITATVTRLAISTTEPPTILGAHITTAPHLLSASLTILATGAWTPSLLDTRGIARCTGQVLAYLPIPDAVEQALKQRPTLLNLSSSSGMFALPPHHGVLKIARHGHGYCNPVEIPHPELPPTSGERITVSLPATNPPPQHLPHEAIETCRHFLADMFPRLYADILGPSADIASHEKQNPSFPFARGRICYYLDTRDGDFLVSYHPGYANRSLLVATGGNGHAFKFLPLLGERVVRILLGSGGGGGGKPAEGAEGAEGADAADDNVWAKKWAWPEERLDEELWQGDGSRGGRRGMVLAEELAKR